MADSYSGAARRNAGNARAAENNAVGNKELWVRLYGSAGIPQGVNHIEVCDEVESALKNACSADLKAAEVNINTQLILGATFFNGSTVVFPRSQEVQNALLAASHISLKWGLFSTSRFQFRKYNNAIKVVLGNVPLCEAPETLERWLDTWTAGREDVRRQNITKNGKVYFTGKWVTFVQEIRSEKPRNVEYESECFGEKSTHNISVFYAGQGENMLNCPKCMETGHRARECPKNTRKRVCEHCSGAGHDSKNCGRKNFNTAEKVVFRQEKDELSNFYRCDLVFPDGDRVASVEAKYQAEVAKRVGKVDLVKDLIQAPTGLAAFKIARANFTEHREKVSEGERRKIMKECLKIKAEQCSEYKQRLLDSGDAEIVEATKNIVWGAGCSSLQETAETTVYKGKNLLGKLHMELRAELREKSENAFSRPETLDSAFLDVSVETDSERGLKRVQDFTPVGRAGKPRKTQSTPRKTQSTPQRFLSGLLKRDKSNGAD